jgi:response regulator NasT
LTVFEHKEVGMSGSLNVLVISESAQSIAMLTDSLREANFRVCAALQPNQDIIGAVKDAAVDVVVAYMEEAKLAFMNQMYHLNQELPKPVIIFTQKSQPELIKGAIAAGVSAFVVDGFSVRRIAAIIELAVARFNEEQALRKELRLTKSKLQERKIIERAKGIIMEKRHLKEDEAYKALRKLAMDKNQRMAEVAEDVINVSKLL